MRTDPADPIGHRPASPDTPVGAYRFDRQTGQLTCRSGALVPLGRRAKALLAVLAEHAGQDVSAARLLDTVWPGQIVDPANVAVQISGLRTAIGDSDGSVILTVHGRGYRLAAPAPAHGPGIGNIPQVRGSLSGRELELANAMRLLQRDRLLVITGLSGTGKTRLACATARDLSGQFPDGQWLVALSGAAVDDADGLAARINAVLGVQGGGAPAAALLDRVAGHRCLLLLDGAELLGDAALNLARRIVESCPQAGVLVTSHHAHPRLKSYCVRLSPLALPGKGAAAEAASAGLFLEVAGAAGLDVPADGPSRAAVDSICRRMGGVPLGIGIAARAASLLGLRAAAEASRDPLHALCGVRRSGPTRHRSVGAAMGWAFGLLTDAERRALAALSGLPGSFAGADAVQALAQAGAQRPQHWLGRLHEKSMLDHGGDGYALNPLVRAFAQRPSAEAWERCGS